ncbi:precorrin-6A/cobalt-precorrin-6A reductase [Tateyamaria sp.]|uniref:precorrin-6A/cobalt-precorrin-6A reductase n=1 Tax=Tateyamaria sp. TaxID=1929288 RepID=UPI003B21221E
MNKGQMIAVLGGARETLRAVEWLTRAGANGVVIWGTGTDPVRTPFRDAPMVSLAETDAILDASHSFDEVTRAIAVARAPAVPYAHVGRAPWVPGPGDLWTEVQTLTEAVAALPSGARVFAATGRGSLDVLAAHDGPVFLRQLARHDLPMPLPNGQFIFGNAPFAVADEVGLLTDLKIDVVLARNIGGAGSFPKLAAARELGLPAVVLRPPARPDGPHLASYEDVQHWVQSL